MKGNLKRSFFGFDTYDVPTFKIDELGRSAEIDVDRLSYGMSVARQQAPVP